MERAAAIVRERGGSAVTWTVWDKNPKAQEFYRRLGARPWSEEILMRWSLDEDGRG
jgi:ribosomal protein S18 acetylase RimI-like enzyme